MKKKYFLLLVIISYIGSLVAKPHPLVESFLPKTLSTSSFLATPFKSGTWRAMVQSPGGVLPFGLEVKVIDAHSFSVYILNGKERLKMDDAVLKGDSIVMSMKIFDAVIVAHVSENRLMGYWKRQRTAKSFVQLPFRAEYNYTHRFVLDAPTAKHNVSGTWATTFYTDRDTTISVGVFEQTGNRVNGTFLTTTGDYRYLDGNVVGDTLYLSTFDGTHVYLFKSKIENNRLVGGFYSGATGFEKMIAQKDPNAALPDLDKLTFLKPGMERISFQFPNLKGSPVSLDDAKFKGKVVVIQLMGSWCPNCMDETNFLAPWYVKNKKRGVEIIGLAYEKSNVLTESAPKLERMKQRFGIEYEVLLAGINDKDVASQSLPMLSKVLAFPTTIIVDKKGKVRQIHTGFSGPGTGKYYDQYVEDFNRLMDKLLSE
ncbi:MAG: TlpA disulfide reductase family protein [Spirosomataceae bacterium]